MFNYNNDPVLDVFAIYQMREHPDYISYDDGDTFSAVDHVVEDDRSEDLTELDMEEIFEVSNVEKQRCTKHSLGVRTERKVSQ